MTGTKDKLRGLFLATLMVTSVFAGAIAFAGTASAEVEQFNDASATNLSADQQLTKQRIAINTTFNGTTSESISLDFSDVDGAEIVSADVSGVDSVESQSLTDSNTTLTLTNVSGSGTDQTMYVTLTWDTSGVSTDTGTESVNITDTNEVATGTPDSAQTSTNFQIVDANEANAFAQPGSTFWRGQGAYFQGDASTTYQIRSVQDDGDVGSLLTEFQTDTNGTAVINTDQSTLENGQQYVITTGNREVVDTNNLGQQTGTVASPEDASNYAWEVQQQTLSAEFADDQISNTGQDTQTSVDLSSNRAAYDVRIEANGLSASQLASIFGVQEQNVIARDTDANTITVGNVPADGQLAANFDEVNAGDYQFTFHGGDTSAEATANISVTETEGALSLEGVVTEQRGDVATINATLQNTNTGYIRIGSDDVGYNVTVQVRDGGDGQVGLRMNTFLAGRVSEESLVFNRSESSADDEDQILSVTRHTEPLQSPLEAGTYDIAAGTGDSPDDLQTLNLQERSTEGIQVWTAPSGTSSDNLNQLLDQVNQTDNVAQGDLAIVQLQASGILGQLQYDSLSQLKQALYNESAGFMLTVAEADPGANQQALKMAMTSSAVENVYLSEEQNSVFVVINTNQQPNTVSDQEWNWEADEQYLASFTLNESNAMIEEDTGTAGVEQEHVETTFTLVEPDAEFDNLNQDDELTLAASQNAQISGTSTLAPGSEITIRIRSDAGQGSAFLKSVETTVGQNGTFSATVDMSNVDPNSTFTAIVRTAGGATLGNEVSGVVVQQSQTPAPGETETPAPGETETPGTTTTPGGTTTTTSTGGGDTTTAAGTTTSDTPGFGVVVALVALVAAALLAVRRDN